jgi:hypothetical protein
MKNISDDYTREQIDAMRDWVKECQWREDWDDDDVDNAPDAVIIRGVARHYEGGLKQFLSDMIPV